MRRIIIIATFAFTTGFSGLVLAQQPVAEKRGVPPEDEAPAVPAAGEKPPVSANPDGTSGSMVDPATAGMPAPSADQPATPVPNTAPPTGAPMPARPKPPAGKVSDAEKDAFLAALEADEEWRNEVKEMLFNRIVIDPKSTMDKTLRARMADTLRPEIHETDAQRMLRNKKHVVYAYAALWILTALFVLFMFLKQKNLTAELVRLRKDLDDAAKEG